MNNVSIKEFLTFLDSSPSPYHTVDSVKSMLLADGYTELFEGDEWKMVDGGKYFVTKNLTSLIAFRYNKDSEGFIAVASHSDFPAYKVKPQGSEISGKYTRIPTERYGGMINYTWFDRPLSVAGRAVINEGDRLSVKLVNVERDLLVIPSVAIHMNRTVNEKFSPSPTSDTIPLMASAEGKSLSDVLADTLQVPSESVIAHDLFLYVRGEGRVFGSSDEFIVAPRIDNLASVYSSLKAFVSSKGERSIPVLAIFDNEEVGSDTKQGAASEFFRDTLERVFGGRKELRRAIAKSFMVSADNAHAIHPNHPELSDGSNAPEMNKGVVIKYNANQKYTTDAVSSAVFKSVANAIGEPLQSYCNRADMPGGSTLGSIANTSVPVSTVDVGIPQLGMHSAVEVAGSADVLSLTKILTRLYSSSLSFDKGCISVK